MRIDRARLLVSLSQFVTADSGVVVGSPGVGKSYLLGELGSVLDARGATYLFLMIDTLGEVTEAELREELGYGGTDLIASLAATARHEEKGLLIIDGYDAARNERTQKNALELIRRARLELRDSWNVIVSVRTYDARKSPELLDLFGQGGGGAGRSDPGIPCRHFVIPEFDDQELGQLRSTSPDLSTILDTATGEFKSLLRTPFHLWLLEKLLPGLGNLEQLAQIRSEVQLLRLFWQRRVADGPRAFDREAILHRLVKEMVAHRSLSVSRANVYDPQLGDSWLDLLSREVLVEAASSAQRVRFRHNILFDYAVSVLVLDDQPDSLLRFLAEDRSRQLFLRPSLVYFFARLWHEGRDAFWTNYHSVLGSPEASVRLVGHLLPPTVVVQEARVIEDLTPLLNTLRTNVTQGPEAILRLLRAIQAWNTPCGVLWLDFFAQVVPHLQWSFAWDLGLIAFRFLEEMKTRPSTQNFSQLGSIARTILKWIWAEKEKNKESRCDAIAAQFGVPLVAQTYRTDAGASRELLEPILAVTKEPDFSIQLVYRVVQYIGDIAPIDPAFTERLYLLVFSTEVRSDARTLMGGGPVFRMTSTRRQDFQMCQYLLLEYFRSYIKLAPVLAFRTAIRCVDQFVEAHHVRRHLNAGFSVADVTKPFAFRGGTAHDMQDSSFIWDRGPDHYEPTQMGDDLRSAIGELAQDPDAISTLNAVLNLFRDEARSGFLWRRLLAVITEHPDHFIDEAYELCLAEPLLTGPDTLYEIGQMLSVFAGKFSMRQRGAIERAIIALVTAVPDDGSREGRTRVRNRLLAQISSDLLVTDEAKAIRADLESTQSLPDNRPLVTMTGGATAFTEEMWLTERGVDLALPVNKELRQAADELVQALGSTRRDQATRDSVEAAYPKAVWLDELLQQDLVDDTTLIASCLTKLAQFANCVVVAIEDRSAEITLFARRILLRCAAHPLPEAEPDMDEKYTSPVWGDSPRSEAAQGLPFLLSRGADPEILEAVRGLANDPVPSIRYLLTHDLSRISQVFPGEFWQLLEEIARRDKNVVVLQGVCESLWWLTGRNEEKAAIVLAALTPRIIEGPDHAELARLFMALTMWLCIVRKHPWAVGLSSQLMNDSVRYSKSLSRATNAAIPFVTASKVGGDEEIAVESAIEWLLRSVDAAEKGLVAISGMKERPAEPEDADLPARNLYSVMDQLVTQMYFALDSKPNARRGVGNEPTAEQRVQLYWRVKPLLKRVLRFAQTPETGILAGPTAYRFMEILNAVLPLDPEGVIEMAWEVVIAGRPHGFNLDSLAIEQVVKITESILADYRLQARADTALGQILEIIEIFSETGWPQALRLVWRLDEVYR